MRRAGAAAVVVLALALPAGAARAQDHGGGHGSAAAVPTLVAMTFDAFAPAHVDVLAGDTVRWSNGSFRPHTVTGADDSWDSGRLVAGDAFDRRFEAPGTVAYHCQIHAGMIGEVGVHALLLDAPAAAAAPGRAFPVTGRSALAAGTPVAVQAAEAAGTRTVATTTVGAAGRFAVSFVPSSSATLRAVAGEMASPEVALLVLDRRVAVTVRRAGSHVLLAVRVTPASPRTTVVAQLRLPERFGWWPVARARLGGASSARLDVPLRRRVPVRVVATLPDGATVLASSGVLHVPPAPVDRGALRPPPSRHPHH